MMTDKEVADFIEWAFAGGNPFMWLRGGWTRTYILSTGWSSKDLLEAYREYKEKKT